MMFFVLASCDNSLELLEDKKETPIIYAFIDAKDTAQYIRIERAFADPDKPAAEIAQIIDSLYYDDITVTLSSNGQEEVLERVDGDAEGYPRQEGAFANAPNYLYKANKITIKPGEEVNLTVKGDKVDASASTIVIDEPSPRNFLGRDIFIDPIGDFDISWRAGKNNEVYAVYLNFNYAEIQGGTKVQKTLPWLVEDYIDVNRLSFEGKLFYSFLNKNLKADPSIQREFTSMGMTLIAGDINVKKAVTIGLANLGITSSGEIPTFSNVKNGLGIFASTYTNERPGLAFTPNGLKELAFNELTKDLNFSHE